MKRQHFLVLPIPLPMKVIKMMARDRGYVDYFTQGETAEDGGNYTQDKEFSTTKVNGRMSRLEVRR